MWSSKPDRDRAALEEAARRGIAVARSKKSSRAYAAIIMSHASFDAGYDAATRRACEAISIAAPDLEHLSYKRHRAEAFERYLLKATVVALAERKAARS